MRCRRKQQRAGTGTKQFPPPPEDAYQFTNLESKKPLHEYFPRCLYYTYHWMTPIIKLIKRQGTIYPRDIYPLPHQMRVSEAADRFERAWNKAAARDASAGRKRQRNLISVCLSAFKSNMLIVFFLIPLHTFMGLVPSIALNHLTEIVSTQNIDNITLDYLLNTGQDAGMKYILSKLFEAALPWILLVFVSQIALAFLLNVVMLTIFQVNTMASQALSDMLYRKILILSELSRSSSISGSIINFIFTDTGKITDFLVFIPMFSSVPFRLVYSILILVTTINPRALGGVLGAVISLPLVVLFVRRQLLFTKHYMACKDIRIKHCTEILTGIRIIKYFSLENVQKVRLKNAREHELLYLIKGKMTNAGMAVVMSSSGPLMLIIAFIILSLTGQLNNATAYSTALVFNTLNMVFNQLPQLFSRFFESMISSDRIIAFFELPNVEGKKFCLRLQREMDCSGLETAKDTGADDADNEMRQATHASSFSTDIRDDKVAIHAVGRPSYSWGQAKHLSLPIILDIYFKQTQDAIKKFRKQLPGLYKDLAHAVTALGSDSNYTSAVNQLNTLLEGSETGLSKRRRDGEGSSSSLLSGECREDDADNTLHVDYTVLYNQIITKREVEALHAPVSSACAYLDKWCKDCDVTPMSMITQISYYKETSYVPLYSDSLLTVVKKHYIHAAIMLMFLTDPKFQNYRKTFKEARDIVTIKDSLPDVVKELELTVNKGELVGVHGRVGSGKSSLLLAILGELANTSSTAQSYVQCRGRIAYCPQMPIIFSGTVRSNILFFTEQDDERLERIIKICSLETDLSLMAQGLETEIGDKGITLSGGQKARVALARAVYADADIYLLDDPLSAVDAHVGNSIWNECILDYLVRKRKKTVIIVSHQVRFFSDCDKVFEMLDGKLLPMTVDEMRQQNLISTPSLQTGTMSQVLLVASAKDSLEKPEGSLELSKSEKNQSASAQKAARLIEDEKHAAVGRVKANVYIEWIKAGGIGIFVLYIVLALLGNGLSQYLSLYITYWSLDSYDLSSTAYILLYIFISIVYIAIVFFARIVFIKSSINTTKQLHFRMVDAILGTRMLFFETNPIGRILNRLSRDTDQCDSAVPNSILPLIDDLLYIFVTLFTIILLSWLSVFFIVPLGIIYAFIFNSFRLVAPQLKRVIPILSSPIFTLIQESITSLPSIRCYGNEEKLIELNRLNLTRSYSADWLMRSMNRWLSFRVNLTMGAFAALMSVSVVIVAPLGNSAQYTGAVLMNSFMLISKLVMFAFAINNLEGSMSSVERVLEYCKLKPEEEDKVYPKSALSDSAGMLKVSSLSLRYRRDLDLVLQDVTFSARRGERIGIVGRTGAGKSSITAALFRLVEPEPGTKIEVDGVELINVPLSRARGQLAIIPQDPFLFSGTVRTSLCYYSQLIADGASSKDIPSGIEKVPDEKLWRVLEQVCMREYFEKQPGGLDAKISESGENLSAGQRQLVCVARALLRDALVIVLDEATAQVDKENDAIIQTTIRTALVDRIVLSIAHRINTIIDFDRVIVVDAGKVREFDTPRALLNNPDSLFSKLVAECNDAADLYQKAGVSNVLTEGQKE